MREFLGPYRASLALGRRRAIVLLFLLSAGIFGAIAWGTYVPLNDERAFLELLASDRPLTEEALFKHTQGFACGGGDFGGFPRPLGPGLSTPGAEPSPGEPNPEEFSCRFIGKDGVPIGPAFPDPFQGGGFGGAQFSTETLEKVRPILLQEQRASVAVLEQTLSPTRALAARILAAGTFFGVLVAVVLAATFFGAEWRWGVWKTLLTHEPRRGRVLLAKFAALWTMIIIGFVGFIAVASGVDAVMRVVSDIDATRGPGFLRLAKLAGRAILSPEVYATIAGALALSLRTSLAGVVSLGFILADSALVTRFNWLRHWLPAQQIATLLPPFPNIVGGYSWVGLQTAGVKCDEQAGVGFSVCTEIILRPIPAWRASLVLSAWIAGFAFLAWTALRSRDAPI